MPATLMERSVRLRSATAAAVALGLVSVTGATAAAPRRTPPCRIFTDKEGDGKPTLAAGLIKSDALDIVSGDIGSGKRYVQAVLRLKSSNYKDDWSTFGYKWIFEFTVAGQKYYLTATANKNSTTPTFHFKMPDGSYNDSGLTGRIGGNAVTWTMPRSKLATPLRKSKYFVDPGGSTRFYNDNTADGAGAKVKYTDQTLNCLNTK